MTARADVWWIDLDRERAALPSYLAVLSPDELSRAERLRVPEALTGFAVTRAVLRSVLAGRLGVPAAALQFDVSTHGKPVLRHYPRVAFNVSHTAARAVVAVATSGPVGVDVERLNPRVDVDGLAQHCFSAAERAALRRIPEGSRLRAFFDGWTRKEAFIKALGSGLSHDLASFTVTLAPGEPARLARPHGDAWQLIGLDAGPDHAAALVMPRGPEPPPVCAFAWSLADFSTTSRGSAATRARAPARGTA